LDIELQVAGVGSLTGIFFAGQTIGSYEQLVYVKKERYQQLFKLLLQEGILFPPSPFETIFISMAHTKEDLERTVQTIEKVLKVLKLK